jgi:hypothetical protein
MIAYTRRVNIRINKGNKPVFLIVFQSCPEYIPEEWKRYYTNRNYKNEGFFLQPTGKGHGEKDADGVEKSTSPMPTSYQGDDRLSSLETLIPTENQLIVLYEKLIPIISNEDIKKQLNTHLSLKREHIFTQKWLLENARKIKDLK